MRPSHVAAYPSAGEIIDGKYQILQMLGEGGMGAVAKAHHILRRAPVALKFMAPHVLTITGAVERFLNEAVAASQIENQHVVTIFDVGKLPTGAPYLVMEFLDGRDLAHMIEHEGHRGIEPPRAVHFVLQILRALQVAHAVGIIHRDLKPSNAFVIKKDGERDFVKLVDFGISKVQQPGQASLTQTNSALGTPLYMSPEQAKSPRDVDLRSDLYSVGCILYELLTGRTPHFAESGELTEILFKLFTQDPTPIQELRQDLPPGLPEVVHHGLARDREVRFATALEFAEALVPFADERSAQVIASLRRPIEHRSEPIPQGSMPAPVPSMAQAFSQLNSMKFPQSALPAVSIAPSQNFAQTPAEHVARTQALAPGSIVPSTQQSSNMAVAGTQSSSVQTGMGVVSDAPAAKAPKTRPAIALIALIPLGLLVAALVGYRSFGNKGAATAEPTPPPPIVAPAPIVPAQPSTSPVEAVNPPASGTSLASALASASASPVKTKPTEKGKTSSDGPKSNEFGKINISAPTK
jgi:serine/threonine-protein kinase